MRKILRLTTVVLVLSTTLLGTAHKEPQGSEDAACVLLGQALSDYRQITSAKTRAEVLKYFTPDGGAQFPSKARYVHPRCGFVPVDVDFDPTNRDQCNFLQNDCA